MFIESFHNFKIFLEKVSFTMKWQTEVEARDGEDYLKINSIDYDSAIKRYVVTRLVCLIEPEPN